MESPSADEIITRLKLEPLPDEGGHYRRVFEAELRAEFQFGATKDTRPAGSIIYYCLQGTEVSRTHRLLVEELYLFLAGDPVELLILEQGEPGRTVQLGQGFAGDEVRHQHVPAGAWQGSRRLAGRNGCGWSLVACIVSPAFAWEDFELGDVAELSREWPEMSDCLAQLT